MRPSFRSRLSTHADAVLMTAFALWLAGIYAARLVLYGWERPLWFDEALAVILISAPSLDSMFGAFNRGADGAPPFWYLLARAGDPLWGHQPVGLRALSSCCLLAAAWVLAALLRPRHSAPVVVAALSSVFLLSEVILVQALEVRFYGMFLLWICLAARLAASVMDEPVPPLRRLVAQWAAHGSLLLLHPFGLFYSGALLGAVGWRDVHRRSWRPAVWASILLAWPVLLLWQGPLLAHFAMTRPYTWVAKPDFLSFLLFSSLLIPLIYPLVFWLLLIGTGPKPASKGHPLRQAALQFRPADPGRTLAIALFLIAPALFVLSWLGHSVFVPRYLIGLAVSWVLVLAWLTQAAASAHPLDAFRPRLLAALYAMACGFYALCPPHGEVDFREDLPPSVMGRYPDLEVLVDSHHAYLFLAMLASRHELPFRNPLAFPADLHAVAQSPVRNLTWTGTQNLIAVGEAFPDQFTILSPQELARRREFLVYATPLSAFTAHRLYESGDYDIHVLHDGKFGRLLHVVRQR